MFYITETNLSQNLLGEFANVLHNLWLMFWQIIIAHTRELKAAFNQPSLHLFSQSLQVFLYFSSAKFFHYQLLQTSSYSPDCKQVLKWFLASVWVSSTVEITHHSLHCLSLTFGLLSLSSKENNRLYTEAKLNLRSVSQPPSSRHYFKETWSILSIKKNYNGNNKEK